MADLETEVGMSAEEFVDGTSRAGELRIIIIVDNDNSLVAEARENELEADLDGRIEIAVAEGKSNPLRQIGGSEIAKPSLLHNDTRGGRVGAR